MLRRGACSPRSAQRIGPEPTRDPRMALPAATAAQLLFVGGVRRRAEAGVWAKNTCARAVERTARMSVEHGVCSDTSILDNFQPEAKTDDAGEPDDADQQRVAVEVLLGDRRPGQAG